MILDHLEGFKFLAFLDHFRTHRVAFNAKKDRWKSKMKEKLVSDDWVPRGTLLPSWNSSIGRFTKRLGRVPVIYSREMARFLVYILEREPHYFVHPVICPLVVCPVRGWADSSGFSERNKPSSSRGSFRGGRRTVHFLRPFDKLLFTKPISLCAQSRLSRPGEIVHRWPFSLAAWYYFYHRRRARFYPDRDRNRRSTRIAFTPLAGCLPYPSNCVHRSERRNRVRSFRTANDYYSFSKMGIPSLVCQF